MRRNILGTIVCMGALVCAACAGSRSFVPAQSNGPATGSAALSATNVTVTITVATKSASEDSLLRRPRYFSRSSKGLLVQAFAHGKSKVLAQTAVDISAGSAACGGKKTTPRTCIATLMLAPGKGDDFAIYDYNAKPKSGKFAKSAKLLAYGKLTNKKIAASAKKNRFTVYLGGVISGLTSNSTPISFAGDGQDHSAALMVDPVDYGNNPITAGKKDPYANPITVSVTETGGTGHTRLSLNGAAGATSVVLKHSTDTVEVLYDGGGTVGYSAVVRLKSKAFKKAGGASSAVAIDPLLLGSTNPALSPGSLALKGNGDYATIEVGEANAPAGTTFTVTTQHCDAIESTLPISQSSASSGSFAVIARGVAATANPAGCGIDVSDGSLDLHVVVSNTYSGSLGTPVIATTPLPDPSASPNEITVGPDGALWFAEFQSGKMGRLETGTLGSHPMASYSLPAGASAAKAIGAYAGPDGNVWFADCANKVVGNMTIAGSNAAHYTVNSGYPYFVATGSDGNMWYTQYYGPVSRISTSGTNVTDFSNGLTGSDLYTMALGPDGNMWFTEGSTPARVAKVTPGGHITEFALPASSGDPWGITAGPDGAMWFTECDGGSGNGAIGRIPVNATSGSDIIEYSTGMTGEQPVDITTGPDGALWFTYWDTQNKVGRITTAGTISEYTIAGASSSPEGWGITAAPDGALYFVEDADNVIGRIAIGSTPARGRPNRVHYAGNRDQRSVRPSRMHRKRASAQWLH